ncbi:MAG: GGDEF domain-containing protein [Planctomycetes bacterium]|nr:GGDEF domain-containing protein [Planctomycetota bacterium]
MSDSPIINILLLATAPHATEHWARTLAQPGVRTWLDPKDVPETVRLDVIVTDGDLQEWGKETLRRHDPGVVAVGTHSQADVHLTADAPQGELRLACRLLARIVALRRRVHRETELKRHLSRQARSDPLTELPNRRSWDTELEARLAAASPQRRLCLAVVDLDHFKRVNDTHGHPVGDAVLRTAGKVLAEGLREGDFVARLGGDEFGLLLWVADTDTARAVIDRVRSGLPERLSRLDLPPVTASAGYCIAPCETDPLIEADKALRQAKQQGRDRTVVAGTLRVP